MKNVIRQQYLASKKMMDNCNYYYANLTDSVFCEQYRSTLSERYVRCLKILLPIFGQGITGIIITIPEEMYNYKMVQKAFNEYEKQLLDLDLISLDDVLTDEQKSAYYGYDGLPL